MRERSGLGTRLPRLRLFARGAAWLRTEEPEKYRRLASRVRAYERASGVLGAGDADIPPEYRVRATLRFAIREGSILLLEAPLAVLGFLAWFPVYLGSKPIVRKVRPAYEALSTYKLLTSAVLALLCMAGWTFLAWWLGGIRWAVGVAAILIPLGLLAIAWHERWIRVEEDARVFLRVASKKRRRERLARMRKDLVEEFDEITRRMGGTPPTATPQD